MKLMIPRAVGCMLLASCQSLLGSQALVTDEVLARFSEGIKEVRKSSAPFDSLERETIRRKALDGLSDAEKLRATAQWMFNHPRRDHASIPGIAVQILLSPKREIQDLGEWRRLMNAEQDSGRFYQLAEMSRYFEEPMFGYGESFMVERSRGLLMRGVAAKHGQSQTENRLSDISIYTFGTITSDLRKADSPFITEVFPGLEDMPESAKVLELARWLKANWPGCEHLEVPKAEPRNGLRHASSPGPRHPAARAPGPRMGEGSGAESHRGGNPVIRLLGLLGLALLVLLVWKTARRSASGGGS